MSLLLCILNFSDCLQNRIASFPSVFSYRAWHKISHLELGIHLYIYACTYIYAFPLLLHQLLLIATFKSVLKAHENKSNKQVFLLSFLPKYFIYLSSRCWEGLHPFPLFRHQAVGEKKNGFNYIPNYFSSCLRP